MEDLSRELDESHSQPEVGSEANSGLFADSDWIGERIPR